MGPLRPHGAPKPCCHGWSWPQAGFSLIFFVFRLAGMPQESLCSTFWFVGLRACPWVSLVCLSGAGRWMPLSLVAFRCGPYGTWSQGLEGLKVRAWDLVQAYPCDRDDSQPPSQPPSQPHGRTLVEYQKSHETGPYASVWQTRR